MVDTRTHTHTHTHTHRLRERERERRSHVPRHTKPVVRTKQLLAVTMHFGLRITYYTQGEGGGGGGGGEN